jgi:hypothetical protein
MTMPLAHRISRMPRKRCGGSFVRDREEDDTDANENLRKVAVFAVSIIKHAKGNLPDDASFAYDDLTGDNLNTNYSIQNNMIFMRILRARCKDRPDLTDALLQFEHNFFQLKAGHINGTRRKHWNKLVELCQHIEEPIMTCSATAVKRFISMKLAEQGDDKSLEYLKGLHSDIGTVFGYLGRRCKYSASNVRVGAYSDPRNPVHQ